jgi:Protein of unknown function (DUF2516)
VLAAGPAVTVFGDIESWILLVLFWALLVLRVWAFADCLARKAAAFPAAGKLTKPAWALINGLSVAIGYFFGVLNFISFISLIATLVYLTDVRPTVREISGGSRW